MSQEYSEIQEQIIHILLRNRNKLQDIIDLGCNLSSFNEEYKSLIEAILDANANKVNLTRKGYKAFLEIKGKSKVDILSEEGLYNKIYMLLRVDENDLPALVRSLNKLYIEARSIDFIEKYTKTRNLDPIGAAQKLVKSFSEVLEDSQQGNDVSFDLIESESFHEIWFKDLEERKANPKSLILCGIKEIDELMGVGFLPGILTVFCADVGGFKSTLMLNVALNVNQRHDVDVLFVPLEMPKLKVYDKIISRETKIPFNKFQNPGGPNGIGEEEIEKVKKVREKWKERTSKFALLDIGMNTTASAIRRQIEKHLNIHKPKMIVIDYLANMKSEINRYGRNDLEIGDMLKDLIKMGHPNQVTEEGFSIVTAAQLGREALKRIRNAKDRTKTNLGSDDIQGSHQYSTYASNIFGMIKDTANPGKRLHFIGIKSRYGSTVYNATGSSSSTLEVQPEISLIRSENVADFGQPDDDLLDKVVNFVPQVQSSDDPLF